MDKIEEVLTRGVENIYPSKEVLEKILRSGKKLRIYNGIDPTGKLHLGHMVVLKKLRQFQDLNQEIIVLIGDFTAQIGDPSDKLATRKKLTKEQVEKNSANYKKLIGKILDLKKANVRFLHNEEWTNKLKPVDMLQLTSYFTVSQLLERNMFQKRIKEGKEIYVHEFLYPIFQAYDSVTMNVDMEIGGNDQTFNMLAGRTLMKKMLGKEKFVLTTQLLAEPGKEKMGKTANNLIALDEKPNEMFGKIMSWPDEIIQSSFTLLTDISLEKLETSKLSPIEKKKWLAQEIVTNLHSEKDAENAEKYFKEVFQKRELPEKDIAVYSIKPAKKQDIIKILTGSGLVSSNSKAKRLINQGGIDIDGFTLNEFSTNKVKNGSVIRAGKKKFVKIKF
jgi:tyrosyl-tRNA synthetase